MTFPILSTVLNVSSIFLEKSRSNGGVTAPLDLAYFSHKFLSSLYFINVYPYKMHFLHQSYRHFMKEYAFPL